MTSTQTKIATVAIRKTVNAPIDKVFKAWTEPDQIVKWFGCPEASYSRVVTYDLRVGGEYRIEMVRENDGPLVVFGNFKEIVPNKKVSFTWTNNFEEHPAQDTLVSVELSSVGTTTEILLQHSLFQTNNAAEGHTMGWGAALDKLAEICISA
jgi:uncharacterized protein YndB with AHSA1/START domain